MVFKKPSNITLTEMAQYIDANNINIEQDILVQYLYYLVSYNTQKRYCFNDLDTNDDFVLFCISKILTRMHNKKEAPIKSIVNYINHVLEPWHAEYVRCFCSGAPELQMYDFDITDFADYMIDTTSELDYNKYIVGSLDILTVVRKYLKTLPRKRHSPEWSNICISCLLTLANRIEAASALLQRPMSADDPMLLSQIVRHVKLKPPVLFHLDESMSSYISVVVNEILHAISAELSYRSSSFVSPSDCMKNLVTAANNDEE